MSFQERDADRGSIDKGRVNGNSLGVSSTALEKGSADEKRHSHVCGPADRERRIGSNA
jgi:hypothetical protein